MIDRANLWAWRCCIGVSKYAICKLSALCYGQLVKETRQNAIDKKIWRFMTCFVLSKSTLKSSVSTKKYRRNSHRVGSVWVIPDTKCWPVVTKISFWCSSSMNSNIFDITRIDLLPVYIRVFNEKRFCELDKVQSHVTLFRDSISASWPNPMRRNFGWASPCCLLLYLRPTIKMDDSKMDVDVPDLQQIAALSSSSAESEMPWVEKYRPSRWVSFITTPLIFLPYSSSYH